jgi:hypothetical protein
MNYTNSTSIENETDNNKYTKENIIVIILLIIFILIPFVVLFYKVFYNPDFNTLEDNLPEDSIPNSTIDNNPLQIAISVDNPLQTDVSDDNDSLPIALPIGNNVNYQYTQDAYVYGSNNC